MSTKVLILRVHTEVSGETEQRGTGMEQYIGFGRSSI